MDESLADIVSSLVQELRQLPTPQADSQRRRAAKPARLEGLDLSRPDVREYLSSLQGKLSGLGRAWPSLGEGEASGEE